MQILQIDQLPREKDALAAIVNQARAAQRKSNLIKFAVGNLLAWSMFVAASGGAGASSPAPLSNSIYLPVVVYGE